MKEHTLAKHAHDEESGYTLHLSEGDVAEILDSQDADLDAYRDIVARQRDEIAQLKRDLEVAKVALRARVHLREVSGK